MMNNDDLIRRLREQAQAHGHVWVDVMRLLLEAAEALEEHHYADLEHEHLGCHTVKTGIYAAPQASPSVASTDSESGSAVEPAVAAALEALRVVDKELTKIISSERPLPPEAERYALITIKNTNRRPITIELNGVPVTMDPGESNDLCLAPAVGTSPQ